MAPSTISLEVTSDHSVPVEPSLGGTVTVLNVSGDTLYYADNSQVSAGNNQGSLAAGQSQTFSPPQWLRSASLSTVTVTVNDPVVTSNSGGSGSSLPSNFVSKTANYTAVANDFVSADATSGAFTVALPTTPATGSLVAVKKTDASGNAVNVSGTVDGDAGGVAVGQQGHGAILAYAGASGWKIAGTFLPGGNSGPTVQVALPNGTDDTTALQASLNAVQAVGGGTLQLQSGNYKTTGLTLTLNTAKVTVRGNSAGATSITNIAAGAGSTSNCCLYVNAGAGGVTLTVPAQQANGFSIHDVQFLGTTTGGCGLYLDSLVQGVVENVWFKGFTSAGIWGSGLILWDVIGVTFTNVVSMGNAFAGVHIAGTGVTFDNSNQWIGGWFINCTGANSAGVNIASRGTSNVFLGSIFEGNVAGGAAGLRDAGINTCLYGCWIEQNAIAMELSGTNHAQYSCTYAADGAAHAIQIDAGAHGVLIKAPQFQSTPPSTPQITIASGATGVVVENPGTLTAAMVTDNSGGQFKMFDPSTALTYRGAWVAATYYQPNDVVTSGNLYRCNTGHTSGGTFSPANWTQVAAIGPTVVPTAVSGAAYTIPVPGGLGTIDPIVLNANTTLTLPAPVLGESFVVPVAQDGTGSRTYSFAATSGAVNWTGGSAPAHSTAANAVDVYEFICIDGTNWNGFLKGAFTANGLFIPTNIAGLTVWLDATQITGQADASSLTTWTDATGNGNSPTTAGTKPTYYKTTSAQLINGLPVVRFNGNANQISPAFGAALTTHTIFAVLNVAAVANNAFYDGIASGNRIQVGFGVSATFFLGMFAGTQLNSTTTGTTGVHVVCSQANGASSLLRWDRTQVASGAAGSQTLTGLTIGTNWNGTALYNGAFGEILVYNSVLSGPQITQVETYLKNKWATP